jgi:hypothetical protein
MRNSGVRKGATGGSLATWGVWIVSAVLVLGVAAALAPLPVVKAANPSQGVLSPTAAIPVTWQGTAVGGASDGEATCVEGVNCDTFTLTLLGTPAEWAGKVVEVRLGWLSQASDYDMYIHKGSNAGPEVAHSFEGITNFEVANINPGVDGTGVYTVHVVYFAATAADQYSGTARVINAVDTASSSGPAPSFTNYAAPPELGNAAGEPTLGVNWKTGKVMYIALRQTLRVGFDDSVAPAAATWEDKSFVTTDKRTNDPILETDPRTGRTFVSQLLFPSKHSLMAFTDDDGQTWTPSQGAGINSGVDHQTVGAGPYAPNVKDRITGLPIGPRAVYPHAVYYASQDIGLAEIARSDDGGFTFGPAIPLWDITQCGGLHGHIKVAGDGTVYVPNSSCGGEQGVAVSEDNGQTWEIRTVPGSRASSSDPSVGIGSDGTIYLGYTDGDITPTVAVSHDKGRTWSSVKSVGANFGFKSVVFPAAVAGDGDRAAVFFLGTSDPSVGDATPTGDDAAYNGRWYGYIAVTYNAGKTWTTVNATPNDPVQRGPICLSGTLCPAPPLAPVDTRNLLDFNDVTVDKQGRVLAAYADGCITAACKAGVDRNLDGKVDGLDNDGTDKATIIRQSGGKGLFAAKKPR